ncbi:MAG: hypothetical protein ABIP47_00480 [Saprospiraceae bacterium]
MRKNNQRLHELDSLAKLERFKIKELETQLDKTERVLAKIYLQYANNPPKKVTVSEDQRLNATIAEANIELQYSISNLQHQMDSLKSIPTNTIMPNDYDTYLNNKTIKSKKQNSDLQKQFDIQSQYLQQLEIKYSIEKENNAQLKKTLNGYSLKLELMDNEKNKSISEIQKTLQIKSTENDSLVKTILTQKNELEQIKLNENLSKKIVNNDSKKTLKEKEKIAQLTTELESSKNKNKELISSQEKQNEELYKLKKTVSEKDEAIRLIQMSNNSLKNDLLIKSNDIKELSENKSKSSNSVKSAQIIVDELNKKNELLENQLSTLKTKQTQLENDNKKNESLVSTLQVKNDEFIKTNELLENQLNTLKTKQTQLEADNKKNESLVSTLQVKNDELIKKNELQENQLNTLKTKQIHLDDDYKKNESLVSTLQVQNNEFIKKIDNQNQQILELRKEASKSSNKINKSEYQDSLVVKNNRINELQLRFTEFQQQTQNNEVELKNKISDLETKLNVLNTKNEKLTKSNAELQKSLIPIAYNDTLKNTKPEVVYKKSTLEKNKPKTTANIPSINKTENSRSSSTLKDGLFLKLQKTISDIHQPGMLVVKEDQYVIIVLPQSYLYLSETAALTPEGASLIQKISNIIQPIKSKQLDIIAFNDKNQISDEFNLNRANTIGKLLVVFGTPATTLNYGSRSYQEGVDVKNYKKGMEILIKVE